MTSHHIPLYRALYTLATVWLIVLTVWCAIKNPQLETQAAIDDATDYGTRMEKK